MARRVVIAIAVVIGLLMASPWLLYWTALSTVNGRPAPPRAPYLSEAKANQLWLCLGQKLPVFIAPMSPLSIAINVVTGNPSKFETTGHFVAWQVAKNHNLRNRANRDMLMWHVTGSGLTIWLTRNWSADEILLAADQVVKAYPVGKRCLRRTRLSYY
ncbi:MAG: hypothetical protein AAF709_14670 [Pseudomonadota bacterium]